MDTTSTADTIAGAMVEEGMVAAVTVEGADTTIEEGGGDYNRNFAPY